MKPAAGIVGVVAHPLKGAKMSIEAVTKRRKNLPSNRLEDGLEAVRVVRGEPQEANTIVGRFENMKATTRERQKNYARMAEEAMQEAGQPVTIKRSGTGGPKIQTSAGDVTPGGSASSLSPNASSSSPKKLSPTSRVSGSSSKTLLQDKPPNHPTRGSTYRAEEAEEVAELAYKRDFERAIELSSSTNRVDGTPTDDVPPPSYTEDRDEEAYKRDLDMAIQLSKAEQAGYEKGLAERLARESEQ